MNYEGECSSDAVGASDENPVSEVGGGKPAMHSKLSLGLVRRELLGDSDELEVNGGFDRVPDGATAANANCSDDFVDIEEFGCGCCCCCPFSLVKVIFRSPLHDSSSYSSPSGSPQSLL